MYMSLAMSFDQFLTRFAACHAAPDDRRATELMSDVAVLREAVGCRCRFAEALGHHDELLRATRDVAVVLELVELAVTWPELDYSGAALIHPADWLEFATEHSWDDPDLAHRLFSAARDIALRRPAGTGADVFLSATIATTKERNL